MYKTSLLARSLPVAPRQNAADWRRRQQSFVDFENFVERFTGAFLLPDYAARIRDELRARTQHHEESIVEFQRIIQVLHDRAELTASPAERVARAIRNSHPQFPPYLKFIRARLLEAG